MSTERPVFNLHSRAASNSVCSETSLSIPRKEILMILSDSLSALQALGKLKADHPLLKQIQELLHKTNADQKKLFLCGFLEMLVFEETRLLIELRKTLLIQNRQPISCLFLYLKPLTAKYVYQLWQKKKTKKKGGGGMKLFWYQISFTNIYRIFQTHCYLFL